MPNNLFEFSEEPGRRVTDNSSQTRFSSLGRYVGKPKVGTWPNSRLIVYLPIGELRWRKAGYSRLDDNPLLQ
jgi:hypothetical protein